MDISNILELTQKSTQKPTLSPKMQQSLEILNMNTGELESYIQTQLEENIFLEKKEDKNTKEEIESLLEYMPNYINNLNPYYKKTDSSNDRNKLDISAEQSNTLNSYIYSQLDIHNLTIDQLNLINVLIDLLDERGYIIDSVKSIALITKLPEFEVEKGIKILQQLDPPGIGARKLNECLKIQLKRMGIKERYLFNIVENHLELLANGHFNKIAKVMGITVSQIKNFYNIIKKLNPKPANGFYSSPANYIFPDIIIIINKDNEFEVIINNTSLTHLYLNNNYRLILKSNKKTEVLSFYKKQLSKANWLINCINQRHLTLYKITNAILEIQMKYFLYGEKYLIPLTLSDIAEKINLHISTISRAISGKYVLCPLGLFAMKKFFSRPLKNPVNKYCDKFNNTYNIKSVLSETIENENKAHPYSDNELCSILSQRGFSIMRRTIAKYRVELNVPNRSIRKIY